MWSLWRWRNVFARPFLACPLLAGLFAGCLTTYTVQPACACNVPVFRYALQRWQPDPLEVLVLHRAPLDDAQVGLVDYLEEVARSRGMTLSVLHAQEYVKEFYASHGYQQHGEVFLEVEIPHVEMWKDL